MEKVNDSPFEARIRALFRQRLEARRLDFVLTDFLIEEIVNGARIQEMEGGVFLQIGHVSFGPNPEGGPDLMAQVDAELRAAHR
ncbi:MAG TPA: hypothetical protein VGU66_11375, partial [Candidatus Elarobacter sp.]|nr:hypothetical protein [Candidatus Elarobacter sp.]